MATREEARSRCISLADIRLIGGLNGLFEDAVFGVVRGLVHAPVAFGFFLQIVAPTFAADLGRASRKGQYNNRDQGDAARQDRNIHGWLPCNWRHFSNEYIC